MATMRDDLVRTLRDHGFTDVTVDVSLSPALVERLDHRARSAALREHGISPAGPRPSARAARFR